jgi:regulatory protein
MPRTPPPITARYLFNVTTWYLERHFTTSSHLRRLLLDRVTRSLREHGGDRAEAEVLVDAELARLVENGALDDRRYANDKARGLHGRGASASKIKAALRAKGVSATIVDDAVKALVVDEETGADVDLRAAGTWARKRRLGPWRKAPVDADGRRKELAKLGRAGFSWGIAKRIVDATDEDAILGES